MFPYQIFSWLAINKKFNLDDVVIGPDTLRLFGMNVTQDDHYRVTIHADDMLNHFQLYPI